MWICPDAFNTMSVGDRNIWHEKMKRIARQIRDAKIPLWFRAGDSDEECRIFVEQKSNWFIEYPRFVDAKGSPIQFNEYGHPILFDKYFPPE
jgi:hypothetical protein